MPATIECTTECATPAAPRRRVLVEAITVDTQRPYKAPLATFLVLAASARAGTRQAETAAVDLGVSELAEVCRN